MPSFLAMSGLASNETRLDEGAINVRIGEGRTAEVLRNLCYQISQDAQKWQELCEQIDELFGVQLDKPDYILERGEIAMTYRDTSGISLDLSSSGRGLQQTLLLLTYMSLHILALFCYLTNRMHILKYSDNGTFIRCLRT